MAIILRNLAKVILPEEHKLEVLKMYYYQAYNSDSVKNYYYNAKEGVVYLPLNRTKLNKVAALLGEEIIDERSQGEPLSKPFVLNPAFSFRPHQTIPSEQLLLHTQLEQYGLLVADCGLGKTCVNTWVAGHLNCKILVLVDQGNLAAQWSDAFKLIWNVAPQMLNGKTKTFADVGIATFQMLNANPELVSRIKKVYGCCLIDEFHTGGGAKTYKDILHKLDNFYRLACTATLKRKGFSNQVLTDVVSDVSVVMKDENSLVPEIRFIETEVPFCSDNPDEYSAILTALSENEARQQLILNLLKREVEEKRKVLFVGPRVESLTYLHKEASKFCNSVLYVGSTTDRQDKALKDGVAQGKIDVIFSDKKMEKGIDIKELDCVVIAKPMNNDSTLLQIVGRVLRPVEGKPTPRVYDLADSGSLAERFANNRKKWYKKAGYKIIEADENLLDKSAFSW